MENGIKNDTGGLSDADLSSLDPLGNIQVTLYNQTYILQIYTL